MRKSMSVVMGEGWARRYAWLGMAYLVIVSALQWSRGGPPVQEAGSGSTLGAVSDLLAFYAAWYGVGLLLLGLGWRCAGPAEAAGERWTR